MVARHEVGDAVSPFVTMKNIASPGATWDCWVVKYHSAPLLQTMVHGEAIDAYILWRQSPHSLVCRVSNEIEENAKAARLLMRQDDFEGARQLTALNLALATWLVEDSQVPAFEEKAQ